MAQTISNWITLGLIVAAGVITLRMYFGPGDD